MELNELKTLWLDIYAKQPEMPMPAVKQLMTRKSKSLVAKMKRNLQWELIAVCVLYGAGILYYLNQPTFKPIAWILGVLGICFVMYYFRKTSLLNALLSPGQQVRYHLELQVRLLARTMRLYSIATAVFTPVVFLLVWLIWFYESKGSWWQFTKESMRFYTWFLITGLSFTIGSYFFNKWYVEKLYGQHLRKLKEMFKEFNEE
ncbi:MAG TPA: hypothetical protein VM012_12330 [Flavitalea sp.]|nr:hypothetical protein [Flavitalea sp.]